MDDKQKQNKKSVWFKLQEAVPDREEQFEFVSLAVRLTLLLWATAMLSLSYLDLSKLGIPQQKIDPTFIASVFTGVLASFNITTASKKGDGTYKAEEEKRKAEAANGSVTTMRFETGVKIIPIQPRQERLATDQITQRPIDPETGKLT